jgi:hypothetical protein
MTPIDRLESGEDLTPTEKLDLHMLLRMEEKDDLERRMEQDGDPRWHRWMGMMTAISGFMQVTAKGEAAQRARKLRSQLIAASRDFALFGEAGPWKSAMDEFGALAIQRISGAPRAAHLPSGEELLQELIEGKKRSKEKWSKNFGVADLVAKYGYATRTITGRIREAKQKAK